MRGSPGFVDVISILIAFDASLSGMMKALVKLDADAPRLTDRSCSSYDRGGGQRELLLFFTLESPLVLTRSPFPLISRPRNQTNSETQRFPRCRVSVIHFLRSRWKSYAALACFSRRE